MPDNIKPQAGPLTPEQQLFKSIADKQLVDLKLDKAKPVTPQPKAAEYKQPTTTNPSEAKDVNGDSYTDEGLVNLVQSLHGNKATAFHATAGSFDYYTNTPQVTDYGKYGLDKDISISSNTTQEQLDMMRADEQSFGAEAANSIMGAIVKAPIKLASSFSSFLVDTDSYSKLNDSMWNQVMKNSTETLNQMDEKVGDVFKIHGADDQADGTFGNREWWMKNAFQEGGAYLLGFMSAGAGISATMARVAQGSSAAIASLATRVYNAATVGGKIEKAAVAARAMLPSIRAGLQGVGDLTSAYMLSDLEAGAEALSVADEVYKEKYNEYLTKGGFDPNGVVPISVQEEADKYAGQIAANAGDVQRNIGRMTMVFNLTGLKYFTGSKLSTTKYVKHTALTAFKDVGLEIPQEMGEEWLMGVGGTLARRQASENLTAENGGGFLSHSHLVSDTWNHVFSQQGAEEAVLGGVLGGLFGGVGEIVKAKSGANKSNNDLADFQASNTTQEGYLKQLLDPKSKISESIKNLKSLSDTQADLFPKITEAHLKGDEISANNMRAQLLQFQAYDYFQKGMGDQLNATMEALTSDKQLAEETFGPDYHEKLTEAKKIIKEAQGVYDTEVPFATPGTEKMLYHNILNRNNISKAIHDVRIDLSKHRQQYIQDLANYTAEGLGVPSMEGLNYDVSKQEEEFKTTNPLSLQKVTENEAKLAELQSQFKQNQAQHNLIRQGKYNEFEMAAKVKGTEEYTAPIVKQEAKLTKEQEIANNTKAQQAQSLANDIQDESKPEITKDVVNQQLDEKLAEIDSQVANEEITPEEAEVEKAKIEEIKAEVETKTTPVVEEVSQEEQLLNDKYRSSQKSKLESKISAIEKEKNKYRRELEEHDRGIVYIKASLLKSQAESVHKINSLEAQIKQLEQLVNSNSKKKQKKSSNIKEQIEDLKGQVKAEYKALSSVVDLQRSIEAKKDQITTIILDLDRQSSYYRNMIVDNSYKLLSKEEVQSKIKALEKDRSFLIKLLDKLNNILLKSKEVLTGIIDIVVSRNRQLNKLIKNLNFKKLDVDGLRSLIDSGVTSDYTSSNKIVSEAESALNEALDLVDFQEVVINNESVRISSINSKIVSIDNNIRYLKELIESPVFKKIDELKTVKDSSDDSSKSVFENQKPIVSTVNQYASGKKSQYTPVNTNKPKRKTKSIINVNEEDVISNEAFFEGLNGGFDLEDGFDDSLSFSDSELEYNDNPFLDYDELPDNENGVLGDNEPIMEIPEDTVTEEVVVKPSKKLVYVPTSISVKTVSSKDNGVNGEASNEGGEGGADIDKVQASNVLDNSENSVQKGTNLFITPTEVLGQKAYQFTTEDGRLVGYLHKPEYVRTSRVAVEKLTDEEREAELAKQTEELKGMWANLDTHFSATSEPYKTVVTDKTPGTINRTPSDNKIKSEILADERVVVIPVIADSSQPGKNKLNLAGLEINEYLEKLGGILDEQSYTYLVDSESANGNHVILVPTAARLGGKIVYNFAFANRTVLSDNPYVRNLVKTVIANYLKGEGSVVDQAFVSDILNIDIEFKLSTNQKRIVTVPIKETNKKALVTPDNMGAIENVGVRIPLPYAHDDIITIAGQELVPQQFIGGTLKSDLNYSTIKGDVKSYVMNPVISFEPIILSSSVVPASEEVIKEESELDLDFDILPSPKDVEDNPLLSLDKLSTKGGFNIIKKQEIVKAISVQMFYQISKKTEGESVSDALAKVKASLAKMKTAYDYVIKNGLNDKLVAAGFTDNKELNEEFSVNLGYTLENWDTLSDNALNLLKETGYSLKKDTKDLSSAEIKPNPEEISDASIQNDTADTVDSTLVDKPEEASSSKYDKMMFEESMYEVSSAFVRTWLNSIGSGKKSVIGGVDSYGGKKLFGELLNIFKDRVYNEEDFKAIITKEGVSKPQFADLAKKFDTLEPHYKVQILNSLDVTKANFRAVNPKGVFDSNRNTKEIQLKEMVNQGLQSLFNEGVGGQPNTLSVYGQAYMTKLNSLLENTDKSAALADVEVISILGDLGVPVSKEVLAKLRADKKAFGKTLLEAIYGSIEAGQKAQTLEEVKMQDKLYYALVGAPASTTKMNLQEYIIESDGDSIVTVEGKKVYPFGIHHATSKLWANLKDRVKGSDLVKNLLSVPFISENTWLKSKTFGQIIYMDGAGVLTAEERKINQQLEEDIERDQKAGRTPDWARIKEMMKKPKNKTYADMTTEEKLMAKFEFFTRSTASNGTYSYWSSAKSDKSVVLGIEAPKVTSGFELAVAKVIAAEAKRINQFAKLPKESGVNGSVFYLFPWLNDMSELFTQTVNGKEVDEKFLQPGYTKLLGYARKAINIEIKTVTETLVKSGVKITDETKKRVEEFVTSEIVNNYNFLSLVSGDPAYFAKKDVPKTMANLFKRLTRDIATAKRGRGVYKDLKVITFKEPEGDNLISKNFAQMEAILGEQASGYKNVQAADAQGYCTIKEYWDLMYGDGLISLEKRDALCKIFDDHFKVKGTVEGLVYSEADLEGILIKPRKPVTIGNKFSKIGDSAVNRPIYIKYSIFPLLPQLLHADSPLIKLCDFMENNGVHRAVAESGFKVGSAKPVNIEAETITATEDQFTVVDREMDGNQLDIPYDETKEAILQGTQLLKLVFDGVADSELKEVFYKNQEALLDKMNSDYITKMGISEVGGKYQITDMEKFKKELAAALSDSFENPNDKVSFETVGNKFKLPLFFNKLGPKIEATLIQGFKKKVLKSKLAGRSFVLVSEYLFKGNTTAIATTPSYDPEKGLLPARLMKGDRLASPKEIEDHYKDPEANPLTVAPAQVMIAWNFKDENGNLLKMSDYVKDGKLDMDKIDPKMLKMIGYRIPTQGHNSISVCEVVGFLPPYMGDTIVAPKDWTVQMGSDFDIDKVFMHFRYGKVDKAGKIVAQLDGDNGLKNTIYNNYEAVLSKTEVFKKMMIPLDFGRLPDIVKELQKIDRFKESQGSILSPVTQVNNYETGTAGKVGVGMSSLLSVFASIIQGKGLTVREGLSIKVGDRIIDLKDLSSPNQLLDPTKSKNMVISAFQSASVDNIKELLVKTINYNSDTHPLLISMSLLGLDEEWISYMMVQDIKPLKIAFENYKGFEPKPLTLELMKQAVSNPTSLTTYEMANLYHHYDSFKLLGDEISKLSGLVNITTNGFGTYFEDINYLQESSSILYNSRALEEQGMKNLMKDGFWGKGFKFMQNTQDVISQLFPVTSPLYQTVVAYGNDLMKYPTKEYKKALKNFVKAYMMSDLSMFGGSVTEQRQRLFYGDNSLAHRASVLKAENPKNSFLQSLSFSFSNDGIKPNLVKYIGKGLTVTEKFLWQQQLKEMFYSENPIEAEFAKDFIIYQYAAGGIQVPTSAISMLPSDLTRLMKLDEDVSKIDWTEASTDVINDILTQFIQHNSGKFKFEKEAPGTKGFFGMMEVVKNIVPNIKEEVVVNEVKTLDEALAEQAEGKFKGVIEDLGQLEPTTVEYVDSAEINNNAGEYDRVTGIIKIATDISKNAQAKTLIHETIHHVLSNTVKEYNMYKAGQAHKLTPEGIVAMRRMERLYTVAQENFAKKGGPKRLENTLKNLDEFMSDMVSEKDVQKWSNDIEVSGESLWSKFKKLATNILQSLGLVKVKEGSLLEAFLDTYLEVKENRIVGNNSTPVRKEPLTTKEIAELNKGRKVRVTFDSLRYNNTFDAVVTGEIFVVSKSFKKNDITGEISDYVEIAHLELRTNTGKLITASVYEIEGLIKESKLNSPKKTSKYNKTTVLAKVGKMNPDLKREFLQHISEATKLNPINIGYLNDTDFDNYYFPSYKARGDANPTKIVRKANIDKMGEYFEAKEKLDREKSYTQKDISEIIKDVANSDRPLAELAKHLVKYADLVKPKIEFTTDLRLPNHATESGFGDKAEGLYNNRTNVISINLGVNHPKGLEYTILHEYMHALTAHEIRRGGPKVDALKDLYEVAKDKLKNKELHTNTRYALLDWDEFIVGIFTNGMFIKELQSLPATGVKYKNLWENVLDSLLNILGITKKDSFYEEAFALATNIVEDHISYEEMMKRQEEFSNFVEDQFEESQFSAGDTMQSIEDFFNNCK